MELDAMTLLVVVDNESDTLSSFARAIRELSDVTHLLERTLGARRRRTMSWESSRTTSNTALTR
jgi:hypothetical protein